MEMRQSLMSCAERRNIIMHIVEIINEITDFVRYVAVGFIFFGTYDFAGLLEREENKEYLIFKTITASFVINEIINFVIISAKVNKKYYYLIIIIASAILGIVLGKVRRSTFLREKTEQTFGRTITDNIFVRMQELAQGKEDEEDMCVCARFCLKDDKNYYEGQIEEVTSIYRTPCILLKYYKVRNKKGKIIKNYSDCDEAFMIINWEDMTKIEILMEK